VGDELFHVAGRTDGQTDRQTDMTKIIVAFFAVLRMRLKSTLV